MKIWKKFVLGYFAIALLGSVVGGYFFYTSSMAAVEGEVTRHLQNTVSSRALHINSVLEMEKETVNMLAADLFLVRFLKEKPAPGSELYITAVNKLKEVINRPHFLEFDLINTNGFIVLSTTPGKIGEYRGDRNFFVEGLKRMFVTTDVRYSHGLGVSIFEIAGPVIDPDTGGVIGVLEVDLSLSLLNDITSERAGLGETGEAYLVNLDGHMLTESRFSTNTTLNQKVDTVNTRQCFSISHMSSQQIKQAHEEHVSVFDDYRGVSVLGTHEYLPEPGWCLIVEIDEYSALGVHREDLLNLGLKNGVVLLLAMLLLTVFLVRRITKPITRLQHAASEIGKGKLDTKICIKTGDEVEDLARAFTAMARRLKKHYAGLEKEVEKRTHDSEQRKTAAMNLLEDLNESKKQLEEQTKELRVSEEKFKTIFEGATDGIIAANPKTHKFKFANPAMCQMLGYSQKELSELGITEIHPKKDLPYVLTQFQKQMRREITLAVNIPVLRKDKSVFYCDVNSTAIKLGQTDYLLGFFRDITERKKSEDELKKTMALREEFIRNVSHELRTPLTTMRIAVEMMGKTSPDLAKTHLYEVMLRNTLRLNTTINSILDLSRIRAGKATYTMRRTSIPRIVENAIEEMDDTATRKGLYLKHSTRGKHPLVQCDSEAIGRVIMNLIANAIKFTEKGGVNITVSSTKDSVVIRVKDTGMGLSKAELARMFTEFFKTNVTKIGTGIGMAISKETVDAHSGKIWCESKGKGKGTTFIFTLPLKKRRSK